MTNANLKLRTKLKLKKVVELIELIELIEVRVRSRMKGKVSNITSELRKELQK